MPIFGAYETLEELHVDPRRAVYRARLGFDGPPRFVVKVCIPPPPTEADDPDEPSWAVQHFLDCARAQQNVTRRGGRHWAPVHDLGQAGDVGYVVVDFIPKSLASFTGESAKSIIASELYDAVNGIIRGLVELREITGRAHGNLKLTNVLLPDGPGTLKLTDPGLIHQARKEGEIGDLQTLGRIIFELVMGRAPGEIESTTDGPAWQRLGKSAQAWREFCDGLLHRQVGGRAPSLLLAGVALESLKPVNRAKPLRQRRSRPVGRRAKQLLAAAAIGTLLVGGTLATLFAVRLSDQARLDAETRQWLDPLRQAAADPVMRQRFEADPALRKVLVDLQSPALLDAGRTTVDSPPWKSFNVARSRRGLAALDQVKSDLSPAHWNRLAWAQQLQRQYAMRGWTQPAVFLQGQIAAATSPSPQLAQGIDQFLTTLSALEAQSPGVEQIWNGLDQSLKTLDGTPSETIRAFARKLRHDATDTVTLEKAGLQGVNPQLQNLRTRADQLAMMARRASVGEVDLVRLGAELTPPLNLARLENSDIDRWLAQVEDYVVAPTEVVRTSDELQQRVGEIAAGLDASQSSAFAPEQERLLASIDRFRHSTFVARDLREDTFARRRDYLQAEVAAAAARYRLTPAQWIEQLPALGGGSSSANAYWESWKGLLRKDLASLSADPAAWRASKRLADQLRTTLKDLDSTFISAAPTDLGDDFNKAARERREKAMGEALALLDTRSPRVDLAAIKRVDESYDEWVRDLRDLVLQFPIRKQLLTLDDRPDVNWRTAAIWREPAVQAAVKADVARIERLQELPHLAVDQLVEVALSTKEPEVSWAAWRLIAQPQQLAETNWPTHAGELEKESRIRAHLQDLLKAVNADEAAVPLAELKRMAPEQWRRFTERAVNEDMLDSALALRTSFGVTPDTIDLLPAHVRFNLLLFTARKQTHDNATAQGIAALVQQLAKAGAGVEPRPDDLLVRLARYQTPEPFAQLEPKDVFVLPAAGLRTPLVFRRVQPGKGRAFYLQTTEISLGEVIDAYQSAGAWEQALRLPWGTQGNSSETRPGLRGWEWTDSPPRLTAALSWGNDADFPAEFRPQAARFNRRALDVRLGGNPTEAHPMQQISVQGAFFTAALLGCRLPTVDEWKAAQASQVKESPPPNLRDATWERERRHLIASNIAPNRWPDRGIFAAAENAGTTPQADRPAEDGTLLFRPVPSGTADSPFKFFDLVGNVAEFVCNASESFDNLPDGSKRSAEGVRQFAIRNSGSIFVIGASALTPLQAPVDQPMPLPRTNEGYADVGFRLAFTAPSRSPAEKLAWALAGQDYVWPQPAPQANAAKQ